MKNHTSCLALQSQYRTMFSLIKKKHVCYDFNSKVDLSKGASPFCRSKTKFRQLVMVVKEVDIAYFLQSFLHLFPQGEVNNLRQQKCVGKHTVRDRLLTTSTG